MLLPGREDSNPARLEDCLQFQYRHLSNGCVAPLLIRGLSEAAPGALAGARRSLR